MGAIRLKKEVIEAWLKGKTTFPQSIEELAQHVDISSSLLSMIFSGDRQATPNVIRKLCEATGYDVGDLCFYDRNKEPKE